MENKNQKREWSLKHAEQAADPSLLHLLAWKKISVLAIVCGLASLYMSNPMFTGGKSLLPAAHAAVPAVDGPIRVALFMESAKYKNPASQVTLSADAGLSVSWRDAGTGAITPLLQTQAQEAVRVYADGIFVKLGDSAELAAISALGQRLANADAAVSIVQRTKQDRPWYSLYAGPYPSVDKAVAAAKAEKGAEVLGPLRLSGGIFASETEAAAQAAAIVEAGFDADVARTSAGFSVLTSGAVNDAALQSLKAKLSAALPAVQWTAVDPKQGYILTRSETVLRKDGGAQSHTAAAFMVGNGAKLWTVPVDAANGSVQVAERSGRSYRGAIEATTLNGKLAVINELPLDQYLYSVLGSELSAAWPMEALKAQAVAARTYALKQGSKYQIANVTDTTNDQVYKGREAEFPAGIQAAEATKGEVLTYKSALIDPLFYSNAGGMTAEATEVWGNSVSYLKSVPSPDEGAQTGKRLWFRIALANGITGYIRSDYAMDTGTKNAVGLAYYSSNEDAVNIRPMPYIDDKGNPSIAQVNRGDRFVVIGQTMESNSYAWMRGPYDAAELEAKLGAALPAASASGIQRLEVTKRGASGRVLEVAVNGQAVKTKYPDSLRSLLGGLPSTRFEIEEWGRYTIQGAGGVQRSSGISTQPIFVVGGTGIAQEYKPEQFFVLGGEGTVKPVSQKPQFVFTGTGSGHGLGMSQWGAKGYAELGYDYVKILQTYYSGVNLTKSST